MRMVDINLLYNAGIGLIDYATNDTNEGVTLTIVCK